MTTDLVSPALVTYRRAMLEDVRPAYAVFRRSLYEYLFRTGMVDEAESKDPPIDAGWARQSVWIEHLWATAAENWVALDRSGAVVGWAMSVERDGVLELTHFFVEPGLQARGVGRGLLERAFPGDHGGHRVIIATQDARALGLYLRAGVSYQGLAVDVMGRPAPAAQGTDLVFEPLGPDDASLDLVGSVEEVIIGHRRDVDVRFLLGMRPAWVARRDGRVAGFCFGAQPRVDGDEQTSVVTGPMAALHAADMPAILDHVLTEAAAAGVEEAYISVPLANRLAVDHLLARGFRIDPFYVLVLADEPSIELDRWIHTGPMFVL